MKQVLMLATMAGPEGVRHVDMPYWLDDDEADALVAAGYARLLSDQGPETAAVAAPEAAVRPAARKRVRKARD